MIPAYQPEYKPPPRPRPRYFVSMLWIVQTFPRPREVRARTMYARALARAWGYSPTSVLADVEHLRKARS